MTHTCKFQLGFNVHKKEFTLPLSENKGKQHHFPSLRLPIFPCALLSLSPLFDPHFHLFLMALPFPSCIPSPATPRDVLKPPSPSLSLTFSSSLCYTYIEYIHILKACKPSIFPHAWGFCSIFFHWFQKSYLLHVTHDMLLDLIVCFLGEAVSYHWATSPLISITQQ